MAAVIIFLDYTLYYTLTTADFTMGKIYCAEWIRMRFCYSICSAKTNEEAFTRLSYRSFTYIIDALFALDVIKCEPLKNHVRFTFKLSVSLTM